MLPLVAIAQGGPDAFDMTQRFANAGAAQLALARVEQFAPASPTAPRWSDWEELRCALLYQTRRHADLVQRVSVLPASAPEKVARSCLLYGARSAVAAAQGAAARDFLARLIWRYEPGADELRRMRLLVIESYLADGKPQEAYALMLRYEQDYRPVDRDTAARFVDALLAAGMEKEAVTWFSPLDEASPMKLLMRLKSNLITPDVAIAQARAQLARNATAAAWWSVVQHAALLQKNRVLQLESLENLLQLGNDRALARNDALAAELWTTYLATAQDIANQNQLLLGDEANIADFASRRLGAAPSLARAFYAYLALQGKTRDTRFGAQLQLVYALVSDKLGLAALRLHADRARFALTQLDPQVRFLLGGLAADASQPVVAIGYWQGLDTPPTLSVDEWQLRLAQVLARTGAAAPTADALKRAIAGKSILPAPMLQRALATVQELQDAGHYKTADDLYRALLPLADSPRKREILFRVGKIAESVNDFAHAADYFLEAALLLEPRANDSFAFSARLQAALNLGRAGLKDDARAQLQWLSKNTKDAAQLEMLRREMQKL